MLLSPVSSRHDAGLYRLVAESIPHLVWTARPDGVLEYFNARVLEYTGRSLAELEGGAWRQVIHPDQLPTCRERWLRSLASGEAYEVEYRLRRHDGAYRWYAGSARPLRGPDGGIFMWFGTCTDIEDRMGAPGESGARVRSLLDLSTDFYWETDAEHRFTVLEVGGRSNPGFFAATRIGRTRWEVPYVFPDADGWRAHREILDAGRPFRDFETARPAADGKVRHYTISGEPVFDAQGALRGYRGVGHEITERKRAEQAWRESERRFQAFMSNMPAVAWIKDSRLRYTYISPAYERQLDRRSADLLGRDDFEVWPEGVARVFRASDEAVTRSAAAHQGTEQSVYPDGSPCHWLVVKFPLADASGAIGVAGMSIDITQRVQSESKLKEYSDRIRQLLRRLAELQEVERRNLAVSLHDLTGQNLTALGIGLDIVRAELPIESAALRARLADMSRLLEQTVSSIRDVMADLRPPALDDYGLLPALHAYAQQFQARTGLRTSVLGTLPADLLPGGHKLAILRVVQEALANAAKHSGGSSMTIAVSHDPRGVRILVEDNGRGLAEPLGARSLMRGGWGLPLMRERAEAIGGALRLESIETGTRVVLDVPLPNGDQRNPR